jgi:hypothetical protein
MNTVFSGDDTSRSPRGTKDDNTTSTTSPTQPSFPQISPHNHSTPAKIQLSPSPFTPTTRVPQPSLNETQKKSSTVGSDGKNRFFKTPTIRSPWRRSQSPAIATTRPSLKKPNKHTSPLSSAQLQATTSDGMCESGEPIPHFDLTPSVDDHKPLDVLFSFISPFFVFFVCLFFG